MPLEGFHPTIQRWFAQRLGEPTAAQRRGWPAIRSGAHVLIAAPTGSGKTLAAFLSALDGLLREGDALEDRTRVLYVSPLKALGNDVQKNLQAPLAQMRELDPTLPEIRVRVRSGDTPARERAAMQKMPPHVLVTTPESLYILLTSDGGRSLLAGVRTLIVDEIHAVLGDKRGSHLALSLERLEALAGPVQRIGLSATQKPIEDVARFLVGVGRECATIDEGHARELDLEIELPPSPLEPVCSHETWSEIYGRIAELAREHRTTLVFVGTRKLAERVAAQLGKLLGEASVACHHSSLSLERRLDAEQRLKAGKLRALVATASLELGIDIGDVDLAIQVGTTRSIAALLQRIGRAGHGVGQVSKGRLFPLTRDELVEAAALMRAVRSGLLDRTPQPSAPLDVLAQQIVAACAVEAWSEDELHARLRRAWPYRHLEREEFDRTVALHVSGNPASFGGRGALLHRDGVQGRLRGSRRARLVAVSSGGAIPDSTQYRVVLEPEGTFIGTIDEDFAVESSTGDVFQLGATSWRVLKLERGVMRVADAAGVPPSLPFWFGEAPARTRELSEEVGAVRERGGDAGWLERECGLRDDARREVALYLDEARAALGELPTQRRLVLERFFDEAGGTQIVLHSPFGGRINRAFGLALRKRFCRSFGFELQAAANEDAIVISLGPQHSFPLEEVFDYLRADTVEALLTQAVLATPLFTTRWRWNAQRALVLERSSGFRRVPPPILRMRADDLLARAFPQAVACGETLPAGDLPIPYEHPLVAQTVHDCLREALDVDGLIEVLQALREGRIERVALDLPEPSPLARSVLAVRPYGFLDDAPLEERRTQAVLARRTLSRDDARTIGALDPEAIERVRAEAWPDPRDAEELHEALGWMGYLREDEVGEWRGWLESLRAAGRVALDEGRWFAAEASRDPKSAMRGRLEALGPIFDDDPSLHELEREGVAMRVAIDGREAWCDRRLLARIQRYTLERLRREIAPVSAADFARFLPHWQHLTRERKLEGPAGVLEVVRQLAGFEIAAKDWERRVLPARVDRYRPEWLDQLALSGAIAWGRLWGSGLSAPRATPIALMPREELEPWLGLTSPVRHGDAAASSDLSGPARASFDALRSRGALFQSEVARVGNLLPSDVECGLGELVSLGLATSDSFASFRALLRPSWRRRHPAVGAGRWSVLRHGDRSPPQPEFVVHALIRRWGVIFRAMLTRERVPTPWRELARAARLLELRGELRGGRFVAGFSGEQFAAPDAVSMLRRLRRDGFPESLSVDDPVIAAAAAGLRPEPTARAFAAGGGTVAQG